MAAVKAALAPYVDGATVGDVVSATRPKPAHDPADPVVKVIPKGWKGEDLRGKRYSECPATFLGMLSHMLDSFAERAEGETDPQKRTYAKWDRENAEAARKWRAKLEGAPEQRTLPSVEQLAAEGVL